MPNVLVTGANGQVGSELRALSNAYEYTFFFTDRGTLDIGDINAVEAFVGDNAIDAILNCAAYTAVDKAQSEPDNADAINHLAVKNLAHIAKTKGITLVHISTDYVFDGTHHRPYIESDATHPMGVYGQSKCDGEAAMLAINPANSLILRTSWVYSSFGANFVKTMVRLGKERTSLGVVFDQVGTPTYARDLARAMLEILPQIESRDVEIYHYSNEGVTSWYDFAKEIMRMAKLSCAIHPLLSQEYPTPTKRPHYSVLDKSKIKKIFAITIPYWKDSLDEMLTILGERK
ncbi:MAG: dTDP-4-dehydrorhamnose reductase [Sulfurovum sp. PC08-66]|nr:MAG: dTDP-4-dehydrorhamnose reductase [Sulfurovum sp. PC08-66]KIM12466.1 MAG: dTDP-4-dehydrorhamnose reductase [Sulfuricurvum sp. PC08-66]